ncbi:hypothetical protein Rhe02_20240 [Rhizocola hellebori]|uniref:Leucine-binding protein domain-containing protein n=2 Tax=Rhizocola hellebori TaxID=1392758 RepID=A0A8J3VFB0_9ACTN|nr:hypothetical protein Rhe02_20240 [Rhizocola hellebori]
MASSGPLRIGVIGNELQGIRYRVGTLEASAEHGPAAELLTREEITDPREAAAALLDAGVHALVSTTLAGLAVLSQAQAACTPLVSTVPVPGAAMPYLFQAGPTREQVDRALMLAVKNAQHDKVAVLSLEGQPTPESEAAARGVTITGIETFAATATSFVDAVKALVAQNPQALIVNAPSPFAGPAARDARTAGWTGPVFVLPEAVGPQLHRVAGAAADGIIAPLPWLAAPSAMPETLPNASTVKRFAAGFEPANGPASVADGSAADAVTLLHLAFLGHRDRESARAQLQAMCCLGVTGVYNHARLIEGALVDMTAQAGTWAPV